MTEGSKPSTSKQRIFEGLIVGIFAGTCATVIGGLIVWSMTQSTKSNLPQPVVQEPSPTPIQPIKIAKSSSDAPVDRPASLRTPKADPILIRAAAALRQQRYTEALQVFETAANDNPW